MYHKAAWLAACAVVCLAASAYSDYSAWGWVKEISLNTTTTGAAVSGTVTNFPVLLRFDDENFDFSRAKSDGADIRFSKCDGTPLPYEVEYWDQDYLQGVVWVKLDTVLGSSTSQVFLMHYGNPSAVDSSTPGSVFDTANAFVGVWHLREEVPGTGTVGAYADATLNAQYGTDMIEAGGQQGAIGNGHDFTGPSGSDAVIVDASSAFTFGKGLTWSCWVYADGEAGAGGQGLVQQWSPKHVGLMLWPAGSGVNALRFEIVNDGVDASVMLTDATMNPGQWYFVAGTFDSATGTGSAWVNNTVKSQAMTLPGDMTTSALFIGQYGYMNWNLDGKLDEVVVSKTARSADWMKLCYANQRPSGQSLVSYGYATWNTQVQVFLNTTATGASVAADVTSFPVLIRLNASTYPGFSSMAAGGADLRFANSHFTPLPCSVERWSVDSAEVWVLVDTIRGDNASQWIMMYHGKAGAVSQSNSAAVFDTANGFVAVWHLDEEGGVPDPKGAYKDATANALDADDYTAATGRQGAVATGTEFAGPDENAGNDMVMVPASPRLQFSNACTWSCWMKADGVAGAGGQGLIQQWQPRHVGLLVADSGTTKNRMRWEIVNDGVDASAIFSEATIDPGRWYYVAGTFDGASDTGRVWVNTVGSSALMTHPGDMTACNLFIGHYGLTNWAFDGHLDEVVVSKTARSPAWLTLCYENQKPEQVLVGIGTVPTRPVMAVSLDTIQVLTASGGSPRDTAFQVSNLGGSHVAYALTASGAWLAASPATGVVAGAGSATTALSFDTDALTEGQYRAVVQIRDYNAINGVDSVVVLLRVINVPVVTVEPVGDTVSAGARVVLRVTATGTAPLSYAWHEVGGTGALGTLDSLVLAAVAAGDTGGYYCIVSNTWGADTSDTALVALEPAAGVVRAQPVPTALVLSGVYPNPSRGTAVIRYGVPQAGLSRVAFQVLDMGGRVVWQTASDGVVEPGYHQVAWNEQSGDGGLLPAGHYLITMTAVVRGTNTVKVHRTQAILLGR